MCDGLSSHNKQKHLQETEKRKEKQQKLVEKAIPNIADAIKTVVSLSKNEDFKIKCFNLVKTKDEEEFSGELKKKLWKIATCRMNIKPPAEDKKIQIVPEGHQPGDKAKKITVPGELTTEKNAVNEGSGEDYFDDLAEEISFYEDQSINGNCPSTDHEEHKTTDASDSGQDSSFDLLAELHWDLIEENLQPSMHVQDSQTNHGPTQGACSNSFSVSEVKEATHQGSTRSAQELQCPAEQDRDNSFPLAEAGLGFTSPKAKVRCHESELEPTQASMHSNDWLQEFSQDCYWVADKDIYKKQETEQFQLILKEIVKACPEASPSDASLSQTVQDTDDFDALAELSVI